MSAQATIPITIAECPACKKPIIGTLLAEVELSVEPAEWRERIGRAVRPTGLDVSHDCMPRVAK